MTCGKPRSFEKVRRRHARWVAIACVLVPAPASAIAQAVSIPTKSIAALPFENLNVDRKNAYFVAGVQGLILTKLAGIGDLKVISGNSTAEYASYPGNLKRVGAQLGVATILEGSVRQAGNQVLISVQLVDAGTGDRIWAQDYAGTLDNVFGVGGDVAEQVAQALQAKLSPVQAARLAVVPTRNPAAYDLFLRARYRDNRSVSNYDIAHWEAAIPLYRQALRRDPGFALAYARLSYAESALAWFGGGGMNVKQLNRQARADAGRALQLAANLAAAHLAAGFSDYWGRGDYPAALRAFAAAIKLKPNAADALTAQAYVERRQGRFNDAVVSLRRALTLDPRNSALAYDLGVTYMAIGRYPDAESALRRALALDPDNLNAKVYYSNAILFRTGDISRALAAAQGGAPALKLQRVSLLTDQRKCSEALALLNDIPDTPDNFAPYGSSKTAQQADLYRLMGNAAKARPLYAQDLPHARAQLDVQQGNALAWVWQSIADDELGIGHTANGLDAVGRSQAIAKKSANKLYVPQVAEAAAELYAAARRPDLAVRLLTKALASPGIGIGYSPVMLWLDPHWNPIRRDPRFQALLKQYAKYKPAGAYDTAPTAGASAPGAHAGRLLKGEPLKAHI